MRIDVIESCRMSGLGVTILAVLIALPLYAISSVMIERRRLGDTVALLPESQILRMVAPMLGPLFLVQCFMADTTQGLRGWFWPACTALFFVHMTITRTRSIRTHGLAINKVSIPWNQIASWDWEWNDARESNWILLVRLQSGRVKKCSLPDQKSKDRVEQALRSACGGKDIAANGA